MAEYKKRNVKKVKAVKPRKSAVSENYKITPFKDIDDEIRVKSAKDAKAERRFEKKKAKYLNKSKPEKRVVYSNKSAAELNSSSGIHIIKGNRTSARIKRLSTAISAIVIIGAILAVQLFSPTGIADLIRNSCLLIGGGTGYPKSINGNKVIDVFSLNGAVSVVTDTYIEIYSDSGKEIVSLQHGHTNPSVSVSENRVLLYDSYNLFVSVFDFSGLIYTREFESKIISANIGRNGTFCVVTKPKDCSSQLNVFNKNNKQLIKYKSSELLGSVAISDSGKYISAISLNADNGHYRSKVKIFKVNSNKPIHDVEVNDLILTIKSLGSGKFVVFENDKIYSLTAKSAVKKELCLNSPIQSMFTQPNGFVASFGAEGNLNESNAKVFSKFGSNKFDVNIVSEPDMMVFSDKYLAAAKGNIIYVYNKEGAKVYSIDCGAVAREFALIGDNLFVASNDNFVEYKISSKE